MSIRKINSDTKHIDHAPQKKKRALEHTANKCKICGQVGFKLLTNVLVCQEQCLQWEEMKKNPGPIGQKIKQARQLKALTQVTLACRIKVKGNSLSEWETGQRLPRLDKLACLAQELGKPFSHFFEKEDPEQQLNVQQGSGGVENMELFIDSVFNTKAFAAVHVTCKVCGNNGCADINLFAICEPDLSYWKTLSPEILGEKIKAARESKSVRQDLVAEKIPVSQTLWSHWENGRKIVQLSDLEKIAAALEVPLKSFFNR